MAATTRKHTAANTPALAGIKLRFNAKMYRAALAAWNGGGEAEARRVVGQWFNDECREERLAELFDGE